jgi:hypothetical protein
MLKIPERLSRRFRMKRTSSMLLRGAGLLPPHVFQMRLYAAGYTVMIPSRLATWLRLVAAAKPEGVQPRPWKPNITGMGADVGVLAGTSSR